MSNQIKVKVDDVFYDKNFLIKKIRSTYITTLSSLKESEMGASKEAVIDYHGHHCDARMTLKREDNNFSITGFESIGRDRIALDKDEIDFESAKISIEKIYYDLDEKEKS